MLLSKIMRKLVQHCYYDSMQVFIPAKNCFSCRLWDIATYLCWGPLIQEIFYLTNSLKFNAEFQTLMRFYLVTTLAK